MRLWNSDPNQRVHRYSSERSNNILLIAAEALAYFASAQHTVLTSRSILEVTLHEFDTREELFSVPELLDIVLRHPQEVAELTPADVRTLQDLWTSLTITR